MGGLKRPENRGLCLISQRGSTSLFTAFPEAKHVLLGATGARVIPGPRAGPGPHKAVLQPLSHQSQVVESMQKLGSASRKPPGKEETSCPQPSDLLCHRPFAKDLMSWGGGSWWQDQAWAQGRLAEEGGLEKASLSWSPLCGGLGVCFRSEERNFREGQCGLRVC